MYLHSFDRWIAEELAQRYRLRYVRYADDFVVLLEDRQAAGEVCKQVGDRLSALGLELNEEKTDVKDLSQHSWDALDFVGFSISPRAVRVRSKNIARFKKRMMKVVLAHPISRTDPRRSLERLIWAMSFRLLGNGFPEPRVCTKCGKKEARRNWMSFFATVTDAGQLRELDKWIRKTVYQEVYRATGVRLTRSDLKRAGLPSLERIYYRYRHELDEIRFCSCGPLDADFVKPSELELLFVPVS